VSPVLRMTLTVKSRRRQVNQGLLVAASLALLVGNAGLSVWKVHQLGAAKAWVAHTHEVLEELQLLLSSLQDAETGQRGFLLTGQPEYLEPYRAGVESNHQHLERLRELTRDNPTQQHDLEAVRSVVGETLAELARTVALRGQGEEGLAAARAVIARNGGKALMDDLRAQVAAMAAAERRLLAERSEAFDGQARTAVVSAVLGLLASLGAFGWAFSSFQARQRQQASAAERLAEAAARLRTTLTSIGDAVIVADEAGRVTLMNGVAEELTGWKAEEATGRPVPEVFHIVSEETRRDVEGPVDQVLREGGVVGLANHTALVARDGRERPIADSGAPIRGAGGRIAGVVLVFRDQTAERRAEEALRSSEHRLRLALEAARAGTWEWDLRTDRNVWSDGLWELFGLARDGREPCYELWRGSIHLADRARVEQAVAAAARTGADLEVEWRVALPDGGLRWLASRGRPDRGPDGSFTRLLGIVLDVTESKRAEQALRESEGRFRLALSISPVTVALQDRELRYVWAHNQRTTRPEEVLGRFDDDLFPPEEAARLRALKQRVLDQGVEIREQLWLTRPGGRICLDTYLEPVRDADGRVTGVGVATVDLTPERLAATELREREERLAVTLRSIADAVIATDEDGRVSLVNEVAEALTGWTAADAGGRPLGEVFRVIGEHSRQPVLNPVDRVLRDGAAVGLANGALLVARDGTERPIAERGAPIHDAGGTVRGVVLVFRDQTAERAAEREQQRAAEALRESEDRLRVVFQASMDAITLSTLEEGVYVAVNDGFCRMSGWSEEEAVGRSALDLGVWCGGEDRARVLSMLRARGQVNNAEVVLGTRDGRLVTGLMSARVIQLRGQELLMSFVRDIGDWKDAEAERNALKARLQESAKLEAIGQLAGGVAHDFNNLLTVILSCASALDETLAAGGTASVEEVREIDAAARRAADLTKQLLLFARKQVVNPIALDLGEVVRDSEKMLRRLLGEDIDLQVVRQPGLWITTIDPGQAAQVIVNLAVNARDAMPAGGTLLLETLNVSVAEGSASHDPELVPGDWVRLLVRDSGAGMNAEVQAHLFEPFFTTKEQGKGTGLGLATVYGIVKQAGGHVHVRSEPGRGTALEVCLPRAQGVAVAASVAPAPASRGGSERILVVEDDPQVRFVTVQALRGAGYDVLALPLPDQALELSRAEISRLDLLVTDVVMPGLDGRALAREMRLRNASLRLLFLSGYTPERIAERGEASLEGELLPKPYTGPVLLAKVRSVLDARADPASRREQAG
jgi:two-component system, cell cycle sensor histidine kinase and response regulator CckA